MLSGTRLERIIPFPYSCPLGFYCHLLYERHSMGTVHIEEYQLLENVPTVTTACSLHLCFFLTLFKYCTSKENKFLNWVYLDKKCNPDHDTEFVLLSPPRWSVFFIYIFSLIKLCKVLMPCNSYSGCMSPAPIPFLISSFLGKAATTCFLGIEKWYFQHHFFIYLKVAWSKRKFLKGMFLQINCETFPWP